MRSGGSATASYNAFKTTSYSLTKWQGYMSLKEDVSFFLLAIGRQMQWGKKDGNNARWYYPIIFKTLFYAQVAGDREEVDDPRATKVSMVTFAGNEFLSFYTDYVGGTNRFIVIGVQQWGVTEIHGVHNSKYDISFPTATYQQQYS